ncbi:MAG: hypothetical protein JOZ22_21890 [Acidobacteriia bacterium]|nr:hypothetical protein [Terriglobia bacterium]
MLAARCCRYCQQSFQPSPYRPQQAVCSQASCQLRRHTEYHRHKIETDTEYAQVVRDSQKKWRATHPDYQKSYWQSHAAAAERNRHLQQRRDRKRRVHLLVKNNSALDLKRSAAEVWLVGAVARDLEKNNLASCQFFVFQALRPGMPQAIGS